MINIKVKLGYCGCSAYIQHYQKQCISMKEDEQGFFSSSQNDV